MFAMKILWSKSGTLKALVTWSGVRNVGFDRVQRKSLFFFSYSLDGDHTPGEKAAIFDVI